MILLPGVCYVHDRVIRWFCRYTGESLFRPQVSLVKSCLSSGFNEYLHVGTVEGMSRVSVCVSVCNIQQIKQN